MAAMGFLLAAMVLAGCGADDEPRSSTTRPSPSLTEHAAPDPSPSPRPARNPPLTRSEQARLDERLRDAAWANNVADARRLIRRGANVNAKDETVQSAYLISTSEGYLDLLRLTLRNGAKIGDKDSWNGTGLIRAAERGHHGVVGELLQAGIARDHVNRIGYQAIHEAVWLGEDTDVLCDHPAGACRRRRAAEPGVARRGAHSAADGAATAATKGWRRC